MDPPRRLEMTPAWLIYCELWRVIARNTWGNQVVTHGKIYIVLGVCIQYDI